MSNDLDEVVRELIRDGEDSDDNNPVRKPETIEDYLEMHKYTSLSEVGLNQELALLLKVRCDRISLRKALFVRGYLTQVPINEIIRTISSPGSVNVYLNSDIVGKENVEKHREIVLSSIEFGTYISSKYSSLSDIGLERGLASLLDVEFNRTPIRKALFVRGYLTQVPINEVIRTIGLPGSVNAYLNPEIVEKENVKKHREIVLNSDEFGTYISNRYSSLSDVGLDRGLASLLSVKLNRTFLRQALFEKGCLTQVPVNEIIASIGKTGFPNVYLNPDVVGKENVEKHREIVLSSDEFKDYILSKYSSLEKVGKVHALASIMNVSYNLHSIRKNLLERGIFIAGKVKKIRRKARYWQNIENVKRELEPIINELGAYPSPGKILEKNPALRNGIQMHHGGYITLKIKLGYADQELSILKEAMMELKDE